jgi:hypothetical protein
MKIVQMLGAGSLDIKTAGLMLYALQTASANLRYAKFEPEKLTHIVIDEDTVDLTRLNGPQWSSRDFSAEERGQHKDEIDMQILSDEHRALNTVANESVAAIAAGREQKRNLPADSGDGSEDDSNDSLAKVLLRRLVPGWEEQKIGP